MSKYIEVQKRKAWFSQRLMGLVEQGQETRGMTLKEIGEVLTGMLPEFVQAPQSDSVSKGDDNAAAA